MSVLQYINLGLDLLVLIALIFCLLRGFIIGFNKSTRRVISIVVPFVLLAIFLGSIAVKILETDISEYNIIEGFTSVKDYAVTLIQENIYTNGSVDVPNSELLVFAESLAVGILKFVIYTVGTILIFAIIGPILRLILSFFNMLIFDDKVVDEKTGKKVKKRKTLFSRLLGMGMGFLEFAVFFIVFLIPIFGTLSITKLAIDDFEQTYEIIENTENSEEVTVSSETSGLNSLLEMLLKTPDKDLTNSTTEELFTEFNNQFDSCITRKIFNITRDKKNDLTVDAKYIGSLLTVKTEHGKLDFVEEYANLRQIIPVVTSKIEVTEEKVMFDFAGVSEEDVTKICDVLKNIQSVKIILPVGFEYLCYAVESGDFEGVEINLSGIKEIDINKEMDTLIDVIQEVAVAAVNLKIDINDPLSIVEDPKLKDSFGDIVNSLLKLQVINKIGVPFVVEKLSELVAKIDKIDTQYLEELITEENLLKILKDDSVLLVDTLQKIYGVGKELINGTSQKLDPISEDEEVLIKESIINIFNLTVIDGHEEGLIKTLLSVEAIKEYVPENVMDDLQINWETEPEKIADIILSVIPVINVENISFEYFIDNKDLTLDIVGKVAESDLFRKAGVLLLESLYNLQVGKEDSVIPEGLQGILNFEALKNTTSEEFKAEMINIVEIIYGLKDLNILFTEDGNIDLNNPEAIKNLLERIFDIGLIKGNETELMNFLIDTFELNSMLEEYGITLEIENVDWETEPGKLANVIIEISNLCGGDLSSLDFTTILEIDPETGQRDQETINQIGKVLDAFNESQIFEPIIFDLIGTLVSNIDDSLSFDLTFSSTEKELIKTNGWANEINRTLNVYDIASESLLGAEDLSSIKGSDVSAIMKEASGSVIASKVLGTVLVETLGVNGYDKLPKNDDGTYKYDFTDPNVLNEQADNIGGLIDLANSMTNLTTETMTEEETVQKLVDELKNLENNELAKDVINEVASEYLGSEIDLSEANFEEEAVILEDVFEIYHADPDNFNLETNTELKEKVEESALAKSILEMLGLA